MSAGRERMLPDRGDGVPLSYPALADRTLAEDLAACERPLFEVFADIAARDLVLMRDDGALVPVGRTDRQVKINGMRVEPGETEAALRGLPGVMDAAALVHGDADAPVLVAFVVPAPGEHGVDHSAGPAADHAGEPITQTTAQLERGWHTTLAASGPGCVVPDGILSRQARSLRSGKTKQYRNYMRQRAWIIVAMPWPQPRLASARRHRRVGCRTAPRSRLVHMPAWFTYPPASHIYAPDRWPHAVAFAFTVRKDYIIVNFTSLHADPLKSE